MPQYCLRSNTTVINAKLNYMGVSHEKAPKKRLCLNILLMTCGFYFINFTSALHFYFQNFKKFHKNREFHKKFFFWTFLKVSPGQGLTVAKPEHVC